LIVRGRWGEEPSQILHLKRAWGTPMRYENIDEPPPGALLDPTVEQLREWRAGIGPLGITVDIENAGPHLVALGLCRVDDEVPVVISFRRGSGSAEPTHSIDELVARIQFIHEVLGDPSIPKVFHNGQAHDVPHLEELGFRVEGYADDTILMAHVAYPEMRKSLQKLAILFAGMPKWKHLVKEEEEGDQK
jgi:hypothetical protein